MEKFKDKYPLILSSCDYDSLRRDYRNMGVEIDSDRCCEYTKITFWGILISCFCVFQVLLHLSVLYIPLYFVAADIVEGLFEIYFVRVRPQKQINEFYEQRELAETKEKLLKELQEQMFTKEKAIEVVSKYKKSTYPEYLEKDIALLFKRIEALIGVAEKIEMYKSFFTAHMPEVLEIVVKDKCDDKEIALAKSAVKALSDFVAKEIKQYRLGVSLDENSTLQAYINLYGTGKKMGGK